MLLGLQEVNMELSDYIETSIYSVLKGLRKVDDRLMREKGMGHIWKGDFDTISTDLVGLKIAKGQGDVNDPSVPPVPVLVFDFDVNVTVSEDQAQTSAVGLSAGTKILNVISAKGKIDAGSNSSNSTLASQNLKFSVPVHFNG